MTNSISTIPLSSLLLLFIPVAAVLWILYRWNLDYKEGIFSIGRMLGQLLIIGYFLSYIFLTDNFLVVLILVSIMILASSWIALRTVKVQRRKLFSIVLFSLSIGGGSILLLVTQGVLNIDPWFEARVTIPLAGMIFSNALNSISLAADRFYDEIQRENDYFIARSKAFKTAMIPMINSLFAVGLVSIPGMMTGQILSGVDPLIAARYQIMVMAMIFASGGISAAIFLSLIKKYY